MTKKATRVMLVGTEGNEDYLVIARQSGFVLGFKPLLGLGPDEGKWGCRLRMVAAPSDIPIAKTPANLEKMTEVFTGIPWQKRSEERFSTMFLKDIGWGIGFPKKIMEVIVEGVTVLFDEIEQKLGDVKFLNRKDAEAFAMEVYETTLKELHDSYEQWKASHEKKTKAADETADVLDFPPSDTEKTDI